MGATACCGALRRHAGAAVLDASPALGQAHSAHADTLAWISPDHVRIDLLHPRHVGVKRILLTQPVARRLETLAALARSPVSDCVCERSRVPARRHLYARAAGENVIDARPRREDHGGSRRERLQRRQAPRVALAQNHEDVGGGVGVLQLCVGQRGAPERHTARLLARADAGGQAVRVGGVFVV